MSLSCWASRTAMLSGRRSGRASPTRSPTRSSRTSRRGGGGWSISSSAPDLERIRAAAPVPGAWLVGGSVRDWLLGRPVTDIDLVVEGDPGDAARALARAGGGSPFPLSERHGAWRVVREGDTVDVARSRGPIADDLGLRDFTVNAIALPLDGGDLLDPHGG